MRVNSRQPSCEKVWRDTGAKYICQSTELLVLPRQELDLNPTFATISPFQVIARLAWPCLACAQTLPLPLLIPFCWPQHPQRNAAQRSTWHVEARRAGDPSSSSSRCRGGRRTSVRITHHAPRMHCMRCCLRCSSTSEDAEERGEIVHSLTG